MASTTWAHRSRGLFPIFPWTGFAFAGPRRLGSLASDWGRHERKQFSAVSAVRGVGVDQGPLARPQALQFYAVYDFWHTSPNFFVIRVGLLLIILCKLCLVPLGRRRMGLQSADPTGTDLTAGVLGPHRIGVRALLHSASACRNHSWSLRGLVNNFSGDACLVARKDKIERTCHRSLGTAEPPERTDAIR